MNRLLLTLMITIICTHLSAQITNVDARFNYSTNSFCAGNTDPYANITGTTNGVFSSSPNTLSLNTTSGKVDLDQSPLGYFTVNYTVPGKYITERLIGNVTIPGNYNNPQSYIAQSITIQNTGWVTDYTLIGTTATYLEIRKGGTNGTLLYSETSPLLNNDWNYLYPINTPFSVTAGETLTLICHVTDYGLGSFTTGQNNSTAVNLGNYMQSSDGVNWVTGSYTNSSNATWLCNSGYRLVDQNGFTSSSFDLEIYGPTAGTFTYANSTYTTNDGNVTPIIIGGDANRSFTSIPAGLDIDDLTGVVNTNNSNAGTYNVSYSSVSPTVNCNVSSSSSSWSDFGAGNGFSAPYEVGQSFTACNTGEIKSATISAITEATKVSIYPGDEVWKFDNSVMPIFTDNTPVITGGTYVFPSGYNLSAGQVYTIMLEGVAGTLEGCNNDCYAGGKSFGPGFMGTLTAMGNWDLNFSVELERSGCSVFNNDFSLTILQLVSSITVKGEGDATTINTAGGTLQMEAAVLPADATNQTVTWSVIAGTGSATIDASGLLSAVSNGTVTVKATANDVSEEFGTAIITISSEVTGISNSSLNAYINIYPSPAGEKLNIKCEGLNIESISIMDIKGNIIKVLSSADNIDVSDLEKGVYILQILSENTVINKRFVKE